MTEPLPHDRESERGLVGAVLMSPAVLSEPSVRAVTAADFHDRAVAEVWHQILELDQAGKAISAETVRLAIRSNGHTADVDELLPALLLAESPTALLAQPYAERVRADAERRRVMLTLHSGYRDLANGKRQPADILAELAEIRPQSIDMASEVSLAPEFVANRGERAADLLPGHFRAGRIGIIAGEVASGKTHVLLDLALAAATGGATFGGVRFRESMSVLYCGGDNPRELLQDRLKELARGRGDELPENLAIFTGALNIASAAGAAKLRRLVEYSRAKLVILDLFTTYVSGVDENAAGEVAPVFVALRQISDATGCTFLLAHQLNKAGILGKAKEWLSAVRGSVGISGSVDFLYTMTQSGDWPAIIRTLRQRKNRDGQEADALSFSIEATEDGGRRLEWQPGHVTNADLEATVLAFVKANPGKTKGDIAHAIGKGRTRVFHAVDALASSGTVCLEKAGRTVKVTAADTMPGML